MARTAATRSPTDARQPAEDGELLGLVEEVERIARRARRMALRGGPADSRVRATVRLRAMLRAWHEDAATTTATAAALALVRGIEGAARRYADEVRELADDTDRPATDRVRTLERLAREVGAQVAARHPTAARLSGPKHLNEIAAAIVALARRPARIPWKLIDLPCRAIQGAPGIESVRVERARHAGKKP